MAKLKPNSSMDTISARILGRFAPIRGSWTIACINIGSMDGIWGKRAGKIVHGLDICTQGYHFCINTKSMDDSRRRACANIASMDDSGKWTNTKTASMDDSDTEGHINAEFVDHGAGESA